MPTEDEFCARIRGELFRLLHRIDWLKGRANLDSDIVELITLALPTYRRNYYSRECEAYCKALGVLAPLVSGGDHTAWRENLGHLHKVLAIETPEPVRTGRARVTGPTMTAATVPAAGVRVRRPDGRH